jgi:AcrR family transcriptional regulator
MLNAIENGVETLSTRERILSAARDVFQRNGTRGTTTREIADRAGVNEATIFRHFGNKMALLDAMREWSCQVSGIATAADNLTGDLEADLVTICKAMYEGMMHNQAIIRIALAEEATDPDALRTPMSGPRQLMASLAAYLQKHVDRGTIKGNAHQIAAMVMGMMFALAMKTQRLDWGEDGRPDALIPAFVTAILNGVKS